MKEWKLSISILLINVLSFILKTQISYLLKLNLPLYYIVILRWPVGSRRLHQNTMVIHRVTMVRTERGCDLRFVRVMSPKLGQ